MTSTVFVVDDNLSVASSTVALLNSCGSEFQALTCNGPFGAMQMTQAIRPNLVLLDATKDTRDALLCALALREFHSIEVILTTTALTIGGTLLHALRQSTRPFPVLCKPIEPLKLIQEIRQHCKKRIDAPRFAIPAHVTESALIARYN